MANKKTQRNTRLATGKQKRSLKVWEETALATARKTERLKALRLARDAEIQTAASDSAIPELPAAATPVVPIPAED